MKNEAWMGESSRLACQSMFPFAALMEAINLLF